MCSMCNVHCASTTTTLYSAFYLRLYSSTLHAPLYYSGCTLDAHIVSAAATVLDARHRGLPNSLFLPIPWILAIAHRLLTCSALRLFVKLMKITVTIILWIVFKNLSWSSILRSKCQRHEPTERCENVPNFNLLDWTKGENLLFHAIFAIIKGAKELNRGVCVCVCVCVCMCVCHVTCGWEIQAVREGERARKFPLLTRPWMTIIQPLSAASRIENLH